MRILIIKLAAIGDVLRTTSILPGLKEKYPNSEISWLTEEYSSNLLKNNNLIDNIFLIEKKEDAENLKREYCDLVINIDEDKRGCKLATEVKKKRIIGAYLKNKKSKNDFLSLKQSLSNNKIVYTKDSSEWFDMGLISVYGKEKADQLKKQNKKTYQEIICDILKIKNSKPILNLDIKEVKFAENFAKKNDIKKEDLVIGLNTSAGKKWQLKQLSLEKTIELADKIYDRFKAKILLFGGPEEKERNEKIKSILKEKIIDTGYNNSLLEFAALINLCNILIASDSLALHIGVALNKKVIAFFGPTSAAEIELYGKGKKILPKIDCLFCYKNECNLKPNCMEKISINEIIKAIKRLR